MSEMRIVPIERSPAQPHLNKIVSFTTEGRVAARDMIASRGGINQAG
jgi:hypothetical protein